MVWIVSEETNIVKNRRGLLSRIITESSTQSPLFSRLAIFFPRIYNFLMLLSGRGQAQQQQPKRNRVAMLEMVRDPSGRVTQIVATENEL